MHKRLLRLFELVREAARRFEEDNGLQIASSLTFTTLLSLVPIVTVALTLLSAFPLFKSLAGEIDGWVFENMLPESVDAIEKYAEQFVENAANLTAVGLVLLAVTSVMLLLTIDDAFNTIWRVRRVRPKLQRVLIYGTLIAAGPPLIGASLSMSSWLVSASAGWTRDIPYADAAMIKLSALGLTSLALALLYYAMPNRPVQIMDAVIGGLLAGGVFELTKQGFGLYVTHFPTYKLVYGAFAAVPVFLLWLYMSWLVVLLGAVVVATLPEWRQQTVQSTPAPGSDFMFALQALHLLWDAQQRGTGVTVPQLHQVLRIRYERIESLLDTLQQAGWIHRAVQKGWVLCRDLNTIAVSEVYKRFVFDPGRPDSEGQPEWGATARAFGSRAGDEAAMTVAELFEAHRAQKPSPAEVLPHA